MTNNYPKFSQKKLDNIKNTMQVLCSKGFYKDIGWEVGTNLKNEKKSLFKGFVGQSDILANKNSIWRIFSMTKPFVSILSLKLIEEGKMRLFDHVSRFLPNLKDPKILTVKDGKEEYSISSNPMTIFHLLTHTSGLSYGFLPDPVANIYRKERVLLDASITLEEEAKNISKFPLVSNPGSNWYYSVSTDILAYIIECVSELPLDELLKKYLFNDLGINNTSFTIEKKNIGNLIPCYGGIDIFSKELVMRNVDIFSSAPPLKPIDFANTYPTDNKNFRRGGHGLFSTLEDYSIFASALLKKSELILSRKSFEMMLTDHTSKNMKPLGINNIFKPTPGLNGDGFGLGFRIRGSGSGANLPGSKGEFGWAGAAETLFFVDPVENFYAVFMAQNLDMPGASALFKQMIYSSLK